MPIQAESSTFVTRNEFDQRTEDMTEIMLKEFDKVYNRFDRLGYSIDNGFEAIELRFNRLDYNLSILAHNTGVLAKYLNLIGSKLGVKDDLPLKES